jgi:hypothetical protein
MSTGKHSIRLTELRRGQRAYAEAAGIPVDEVNVSRRPDGTYTFHKAEQQARKNPDTDDDWDDLINRRKTP